jgi:hypothetical protein
MAEVDIERYVTHSKADIDAYVARSKALDLGDVPWHEVPRYPLSTDTVRTLRYMQDIEGHTIIYLRSLLATRAVDDPEIATFLACWLYEETFHALALARFLEAAGHPLGPRELPRGKEKIGQRLEGFVTAFVSKAWPDFCALHMTWGAINELLTLTGYRRLQDVANHPVLTELLARIMRDESRHFSFYYHQAEIRLARRGVAPVVRRIVKSYWGPVGTGVAPIADTLFLGRYLFSGPEGAAAAQKIDDTISRLPGFADVRPVSTWVAKYANQPAEGTSN